MSDWPLVAVRWGLYLDLGALFGLPAFARYGLPAAARMTAFSLRWPIVALSLSGLGLSAAGFLLMAAAMLGVGVTQVDRATLIMLLTDTGIGWAWTARVLALLAVLALALARRHWTMRYCRALVLPGGIAVASLAWTGHGAAGEGVRGTAQLLGDILHLLAASAWLGALIAFLLLVGRARDAESLYIARDALAGFARAGTAIVAVLILTGLLNGYILVGPERLGMLVTTDYGRLLLAKLGLFAAMLVLAAVNRWQLAPALQGDATPTTMARLQLSLGLEFSAILAVLAVVSWLGTLAPPASL